MDSFSMMEKYNIKKIELDGETVFFHHLSQDKEKLKVYMDALKDGKITFFDANVLSKLRKSYYGFFSGLIYLYYEPTNSHNIGNKVELLANVLQNTELQIVHGDTNSTREIRFFQYDLEHLDFNSWIEVREGQKTWVYDLFSMMKFEKDIYYFLEQPEIQKIVSKEKIAYVLDLESSDFSQFHDGFSFLLPAFLKEAGQTIDKHPFKDLLVPEFTRFKDAIHYEDLMLEWNTEIKKKS